MHVLQVPPMPTKEPERLFPYMAGVITANDVRQKGTGKFAADFVSWAKVMQLINQHHNGWQPQLAMNPEGGHVNGPMPSPTTAISQFSLILLLVLI